MLRADKIIVFDTDVVIPFQVYDGDGLTDAELEAAISDFTAPLRDITGWTLGFYMRVKPGTDDPPLIYKSIGDGVEIVGSFGGSPEQTVEVTFADTDTYDPTVSPPVLIKPRVYQYALKRLDAGAEAVLVWGTLKIDKKAAWE